MIAVYPSHNLLFLKMPILSLKLDSMDILKTILLIIFIFV